MADRRTTHTGKDRHGDITRLCGAWGTATNGEAIVHIERGVHTYFVRDSRGRRADVHVVRGPTGKYLRTDPNSTCADNLDTLPNC